MNSPSNIKFLRLSKILLNASKIKEIEEGPFQEALIKICTSACNGLRIERSSVWLLDPFNSVLTCQMTCSSIGIIPNETLEIKENLYPNYFKALLEERLIVANDANNHPHTKEFKENYFIPLDITSTLDCPVRLRGKMIGLLCCENIGPIKNWSQEEQSFASSLADIISLAMVANEKKVAEKKWKAINSIK